MGPGSMDELEPRYVERWLEVARCYLFAGRATRHATVAGGTLGRARVDTRGGRLRLLSRARQQVLRLVPHAHPPGENPLRRLEIALWRHVSLIAEYPEAPRHLLAWYTQAEDARMRRRIQRVIDLYESRLCRLVADARAQGLVRHEVEPQTAARLLVATIQILVLGTRADPCPRETLLARAERMLPACLDAMRAAAPA